jgi:hypothetical protein
MVFVLPFAVAYTNEDQRHRNFLPSIEQWHNLMLVRRAYLQTKPPHDCRCLVQFVVDAEKMHDRSGFKTADEMIRDGDWRRTYSIVTRKNPTVQIAPASFGSDKWWKRRCANIKANCSAS